MADLLEVLKNALGFSAPVDPYKDTPLVKTSLGTGLNPGASAPDLGVLLSSMLTQPQPSGLEQFRPRPVASEDLSDPAITGDLLPVLAEAMLSSSSLGAPDLEAESKKRKKTGNKFVDDTNDNTTNSGIRAVLGPDGKITLTNLVTPAGKEMADYTGNATTISKGFSDYDETGKGLGEQAPVQATPGQVTQQNNAQTLLQQMRVAPDNASRLAIMDTLRNAVVTETTRLQQDALTHASNMYQVPDLESRLNQSIAKDRMNPQMLGDSPTTTALRNEVDQARQRANVEAGNILNRNITYKSLQLTANSAEDEAKKAAAQEARKSQIEDTMSLRTKEREAERTAKLEFEASNLLQETKDRARFVHPELRNASDVQVMEALQTHKTKGDGYVNALEAPAEALPGMAINGNKFAEAIIVAKEQEKAGIPAADTLRRLDEIKKLSANKEALKRGIALISGTSGDNLKAELARVNAMNAPMAKKEDKAIGEEYKARALLAAYQDSVMSNFLQNPGQWGDDPALLAAVEGAKKIGKSSLEDVLVQYIGSATGPERVAKLNSFITTAVNASRKTAGSQFAAINPIALKAQLESLEVQRITSLGMATGGGYNPNGAAPTGNPWWSGR